MKAPRYRVPAAEHRFEETIQRSRFITTVARARSPEEAHAFIDGIRREHPDATHNCWAFVAGPPGDTARIGMSDDGEPHGTAGRPMLTTLLHASVGEIVAVCTRYYGGVKLGTGGLVRAYTSGVKGALEGLPTKERVERVPVEIRVSYEFVDALRRLLEDREVVVESETYGADVRYGCAAPESGLIALCDAVASLTRGGGQVRRLAAPDAED